MLIIFLSFPLFGFPRCRNVIDVIVNNNNNKNNNTVEPVYNGPVLSGHPLLSGQFLKSRFFAHTNAVFGTCIRRPPLLSGRSHPVAVPCLSFFVIFTCIKRPALNRKAICTVPWITEIVAGNANSQRLALQTKVSNSEVPNARVPLV